MTTHTVGTQAEWEAARKELRKREEELSKLDEEIAKQRSELPWVRVDKEYVFDTEEGQKTLVELFDGRSQLLIYQLMFGPSYEAACPGCTALADSLDNAAVHLAHKDVTLMCISRAPIEKLRAYKQRMGWQFPYVSSYRTDFNFDFGFSNTKEQLQTGELAKTVAEADDWLKDWAESVGSDLESGLSENPGWNAFALEDGVVYHTSTRLAPDRFLLSAYYDLLLDQVPGGRDGPFPLRRRDEYDAA
jgi:predicted dithiol-disulfide oxidoreductase (DUF899 family)